jgi:hypothetical protein
MNNEKDTEPIEIDFDLLSEGCMSNLFFTLALVLIFILAYICN